jgi:tetratricopeptide (TPR) repeat protein
LAEAKNMGAVPFKVWPHDSVKTYEATFELGYHHFEKGEYDKAINILREVITVSPKNLCALYTLACAL